MTKNENKQKTLKTKTKGNQKKITRGTENISQTRDVLASLYKVHIVHNAPSTRVRIFLKPHIFTRIGLPSTLNQ